MPSNVDPLIEAVYTRPQISEFLEKTDPQLLLGLDKIYMTTNPLDPEMGVKIRIFGDDLPSTWDTQLEPSRNDNNLELDKDDTDKCKMVQDYYLRNRVRFLDVGTLAGQKRLAIETDAVGSSIVLHFYHRQDIALNLAKGWLALAKALLGGDFGVDAIISVSFARFGANDETSRVKIQSTCQPTAKMIREIEKILKEVPLKCTLRIKNDVATYISSLIRDKKMRWIYFEPPLKETFNVDLLAEQLENMKT